MAAGLAACVTIAILFVLGFLTASHIASIAIAAQHWTTTACYSGFDLSLQMWLMVSGTVGCSVVLYMALAFGCLVCGAVADGSNSVVALIAIVFSSVTLVIVIVAASLFQIAWLVIGIVILAQVGEECRAEHLPLWQMSIAAVVFLGLGVIGNCCGGRAQSRSDN